MAAASRGAQAVEGHLVVSLLPGDGRQQTAELDLALFSGMGQARNLINVLSADVVVVCGGGCAGTASKAAHAIKAERPLILLAVPPLWREFFCSLSAAVQCTDAVADCCSRIEALLPQGRGRSASQCQKSAAAALPPGRLAQQRPPGAAFPPCPLRALLPGAGAHHRRTDPRPAAVTQVPQGDHTRRCDQALVPEAQAGLAALRAPVDAATQGESISSSRTLGPAWGQQD